MKIFRRILFAGWMLLLLTAVLALAFPKPVLGILHPIARCFPLISIALMAGTFVYIAMHLYRMKRPTLPR